MKENLERTVEVAGTPAAAPAQEVSPDITVTIRDGKAILIGTVRSCEERRVAEHAAWAFPDVREIDDRLAVISIPCAVKGPGEAAARASLPPTLHTGPLRSA